MFTKCANPQCPTRFEYHLGGTFYRFHQGKRASERERNTHSVIHFWLCPQCAEAYALDYDGVHCLLIQSISYRAEAYGTPKGARRKSALRPEEEEPHLAHAGPTRGATS